MSPAYIHERVPWGSILGVLAYEISHADDETAVERQNWKLFKEPDKVLHAGCLYTVLPSTSCFSERQRQFHCLRRPPQVYGCPPNSLRAIVLSLDNAIQARDRPTSAPPNFPLGTPHLREEMLHSSWEYAEKHLYASPCQTHSVSPSLHHASPLSYKSNLRSPPPSSPLFFQRSEYPPWGAHFLPPPGSIYARLLEENYYDPWRHFDWRRPERDLWPPYLMYPSSYSPHPSAYSPLAQYSRQSFIVPPGTPGCADCVSTESRRKEGEGEKRGVKEVIECEESPPSPLLPPIHISVERLFEAARGRGSTVTSRNGLKVQRTPLLMRTLSSVEREVPEKKGGGQSDVSPASPLPLSRDPFCIRATLELKRILLRERCPRSRPAGVDLGGLSLEIVERAREGRPVGVREETEHFCAHLKTPKKSGHLSLSKLEDSSSTGISTPGEGEDKEERKGWRKEEEWRRGHWRWAWGIGGGCRWSRKKRKKKKRKLWIPVC